MLIQCQLSEDDAMSYVDVYVLGIGDPYNPLLTYESIPGVSIGSIVNVPYGNKKVLAIVINIHNSAPGFVTKPVIEQLYQQTLPKHLLNAGHWMSDYYHEPLQRAFESLVIAKKKMKRVKVSTETIHHKKKGFALNIEQQDAYDAVVQSLNSHRKFMLHGVTGSGKTEVYLSIMEKVLELGKSVIYLVPEIALTPQTVTRVRDRLGDCIKVMTSQLADGERFQLIHDIEQGRCKVVVGSRSALFSPFHDLGLIVIDECHDGSYKQDASPHYHAVTTAEEICRDLNIPIIIGSATPKISQFYRTNESDQISDYRLLSLTKRAGEAALPLVAIADMRDELKKRNFTTMSDSLENVLRETLSRNEQAVLFINRRGFAHALVCRACGWRAMCPRCSVALVYHRDYFGKKNAMVCHQCEHTDGMKASCPSCQSLYIKPLGSGTERVVEDVAKCFPEARICRMDRDTTSKKGSHEELYHAFSKREYDVLIGTQMVTKGWDMPHVTCVGIMNADSMLHMSFYDAAEQAFALMMQVSGRAGRSKERPGNVVIQTYSPEHYAVTSAAQHDFAGFYTQEKMFRSLLKYPPFSTLVELTLSHEKHETVKRKADDLAIKLQEKIKLIRQNDTIDGVCEILGPIHAPILRVNEIYYYQILLKGDKAIIDQALEVVPKEWSINVDI